ncbi:hypothetical protein CR51_35510 [Caballeronia megalochromosomata]|nr:hypothetical protein CR51_35510 [Caballeronia megalochromosomata]
MAPVRALKMPRRNRRNALILWVKRARLPFAGAHSSIGAILKESWRLLNGVLSVFATIDVFIRDKLPNIAEWEVIVLVAAFFICPIGVAALFAFALFADRHFKDSLAVPRRHVAETKAVEAHRQKRSNRSSFEIL